MPLNLIQHTQLNPVLELSNQNYCDKVTYNWPKIENVLKNLHLSQLVFEKMQLKIRDKLQMQLNLFLISKQNTKTNTICQINDSFFFK